MIKILTTETFDKWLDRLKDENAKAKITLRLVSVARGSFGDAEPVGNGVSELRIHYGPGYRIYFLRRGAELIVLLCGGNKKTQSKDIKDAKRIAAQWRN
ncbi:type II toxin-antitoxin system RelE/ParE family toxin [Cohaesibacter marisflavi]|uniref:type II toxin-antitoxin system RelE/ParE family toxin n=1 Tax=Cohaesibacter marisflavi TaxID=655353 RepID=UPI0029C8CBCC|nr:type II toxin-antitoxin system RelE/ParE family toxin [Cohaesibacter marisflavi]